MTIIQQLFKHNCNKCKIIDKINIPAVGFILSSSSIDFHYQPILFSEKTWFYIIWC